jgi:hypothetical protein
VAEVKAEPIVGDERAGLMDMIADNLSQRPMKDVGSRVILANSFPAFVADGEIGVLAELDDARRDDAAVSVKTWNGELRIAHRHDACWGDDGSRVADLAPGLRVERRTIHEELDLSPFLSFLDRLTFGNDRQDPAEAHFTFVSGELG